jgi:hypothetical protein
MGSNAGPGKVYNTEVNLSKPFVVSGTGAADLPAALKKRGLPENTTSEELTSLLKKEGYDSLIVLSDRADGRAINELVVFDDSKIKIRMRKIL